MFMSFSSLLIFWHIPLANDMTLNNSGAWICGQYDTPVILKYDASLKSTIRELEISGKCHSQFLQN